MSAQIQRKITFGDAGRQSMLKGVQLIRDAVAVTMGPSGRCVIYHDHYMLPRVTKDGVTVANQVHCSDPIENIGMEMVRLAARDTVNDAGDGTTTATVLAGALIERGMDQVSRGVNVSQFRDGMNAAREDAVEYIKSVAKPCGLDESDFLRNIATISANGDTQIGDMIVDAILEVKEDGVVIIEESRTSQDELEIMEGTQFERGWTNPFFVTNEQDMTVEYEDALILLHQDVLNNFNELVPALNYAHQAKRPLVIIAQNYMSNVIEALVTNKMQNGVRVVAIQAPLFGDRQRAVLDDLAVMTGARTFGRQIAHSLDRMSPQDLGSCSKFIATRSRFTLIEGKGDPAVIASRADAIRKQIQNADQDYDREKLRERLAKFTGGVAVIRVGGNSDFELKERKDRIDDALNATLAAVHSGIVPGAGKIQTLTSDELYKRLEGLKATSAYVAGYRLVADTLGVCFEQICKNCDVNHEIVKRDIDYNIGGILRMAHACVGEENGWWDQATWTGYDAAGGRVCNLLEAGIIDPAKVTIASLTNAVSVASQFLTAGCVIGIPEQVTDEQEI